MATQGINAEHILQKTLSVLNPFRATRPDVAGDSDLAGPLVFCLASSVTQCTEFPIPSFIEVFRLSFREFPRLLGRYCS